MTSPLDRLARSSQLQRILFGPVAAVRPYLVLKTTLLFLAFDMWLTRASHAGRYGAGGFNVAHFEWLDAVQPPVSPTVYVAVCVLTGALCFAIAIGERAPRWLIGVALVVHTWSWAMSMLDSYQHHYLLSLVLTSLLFFPRLTAEQALLVVHPRPKPKARKKHKRGARDADPEPAPHGLLDPAPLVSAWAFLLLGASIAVVYAYTAYSKTDPEWLSGAALQRVLHLGVEAPPPDADDPLRPFRVLLGAFGFEGQQMWYLMGHSVVLVQIVCASGYLLAPLRDSVRSRAFDAFLLVALVTALSFHLGAEYMDLKIGWFSWYMVGYAAFFFLPAQWLAVVARVFLPLRGASYGMEVVAARLVVAFVLGAVGFGADLWPLSALGAVLLLAWPIRYVAHMVWLETSEPAPAWLVYGSGMLAAGLSWLAGRGVDLPGAELAGLAVAALVVIAYAAVQMRRGDLPRLSGFALGVTLGAISLLASVSLSDVRWDYYRNVGGDHRRRGEPLEAYVAYVKANRYAPDGEDRQRREDEMRALLEAQDIPLPEVP